MSLGSLLLIFTGTLLVAVLLAGIVTSFGYFRGYVSEQLAGHARDGATAIGLSLSNAIDGADPVASASLIDAVFDSGRYLSIRYLDLQGAPVAGRAKPLSSPGVPGAWRTCPCRWPRRRWSGAGGAWARCRWSATRGGLIVICGGSVLP
jgi:hypothetical protein